MHLLWKGGTFERIFYLLSAFLSILLALGNSDVSAEVKIICGIFFAVHGIFCILLFKSKSVKMYLETREYEE